MLDFNGLNRGGYGLEEDISQLDSCGVQAWDYDFLYLDCINFIYMKLFISFSGLEFLYLWWIFKLCFTGEVV